MKFSLFYIKNTRLVNVKQNVFEDFCVNSITHFQNGKLVVAHVNFFTVRKRSLFSQARVENSRGGGACVAGETATVADGTHPTGSILVYQLVPSRKNTNMRVHM